MRTVFFLVCILLLLPMAKAQEDNVLEDINVDNLGNVTDEFQEAFFEALQQKAIENYDRAIIALDKCIGMRPNEAILYFEKAKNLAMMGEPQLAEDNYNKALQLKPNQRDIMEGLYEIYYSEQNFEKAIELVLQLAKFDLQYKEDLARIYVQQRNFEGAIEILDELDEKLGRDAYREQIRERAYALSGGSLQQKEIQERIEANPEAEQNYLNLIYVYSAQGETEKAYETAQKLLKINPKSDVVHLALYKFNLENGDVDKAVESMNRVLKSTTIEAKAKHSVLNDFLIYVDQNPEYGEELERAIALFSEKEEVDINQELADYYLRNSDRAKALQYYTDAYKKEPENFAVLKNLILLLLEDNNFDRAIAITDEALVLYPSQPLFYLAYGVAQNGKGNPKEAIDYLEMGVDYVIEDPKMESDFYRQLALAHDQLGNTAKAASYRKMATDLTQ